MNHPPQGKHQAPRQQDRSELLRRGTQRHQL